MTTTPSTAPGPLLDEQFPVPYITSREGEDDVSWSRLALRPYGNTLGLCYTDEQEQDRLHGVLYARVTQRLEGAWPAGRPLWKTSHPRRQRAMMTALRCHVCTGPPSRNRLGLLFVDVPPSGSRRPRGWLEGKTTLQPPVCLRHAKKAIDLCPHLEREGYVAVRVRDPRPYGLRGTPFQIGTGLMLRPALVNGTRQELTIALTHRNRHLFLASQLAMQINGVTEVDLDEELANAEPAHLAHPTQTSADTAGHAMPQPTFPPQARTAAGRTGDTRTASLNERRSPGAVAHIPLEQETVRCTRPGQAAVRGDFEREAL